MAAPRAESVYRSEKVYRRSCRTADRQAEKRDKESDRHGTQLRAPDRDRRAQQRVLPEARGYSVEGKRETERRFRAA